MKIGHRFGLWQSTSKTSRNGGFRIDANANNFPILKKCALSYLEILPGNFREPHWHPNAHELGFCLSGNGLVSIYSGEEHAQFTIKKHTLSFIPKGSIHSITNTGDTPLKMIICFSDENPEDLELSNSVRHFSNSVLSATFSKPESFITQLKNNQEESFIVDGFKTQPGLYKTSPFQYAFDIHDPNLANDGGFAKMTNAFVFKELQDLSMYYLILDKDGVREPHWHPNTHELNYLISGNAKISILSPNGDFDEFDMEEGDISFLPQGYIHNIENTGIQPAEFAVFFNTDNPGDIGLSAALTTFSPEMLAQLFKMDLSTLKTLELFPYNRLIVKK